MNVKYRKKRSVNVQQQHLLVQIEFQLKGPTKKLKDFNLCLILQGQRPKDFDHKATHYVIFKLINLQLKEDKSDLSLNDSLISVIVCNLPSQTATRSVRRTPRVHSEQYLESDKLIGHYVWKRPTTQRSVLSQGVSSYCCCHGVATLRNYEPNHCDSDHEWAHGWKVAFF